MMKKRKKYWSDTTWTLLDETRYLDGLGSWCGNTIKTRKELLHKYVDSLQLRADEPEWLENAKRYAKQLLFDEYDETI